MSNYICFNYVKFVFIKKNFNFYQVEKKCSIYLEFLKYLMNFYNIFEKERKINREFFLINIFCIFQNFYKNKNVERCVEKKYEVERLLRVMCYFYLYAVFNRVIISD